LKENERRMSLIDDSFQGGLFQRSSDPSDVDGKQDHDFPLASALRPLSAPCDGTGLEDTAEDESVIVFFRALRVFKGESSWPTPLDQVGSWADEGKSLEEDGRSARSPGSYHCSFAVISVERERFKGKGGFRR
jgi:hypothetical protein